MSIGATFRNGFAARAKDVPLIGLSGKPSAEFSFTPWLQPGDRGAQQKTVNRFNGLLRFGGTFRVNPFVLKFIKPVTYDAVYLSIPRKTVETVP